jgi:hypothetical protein
LPLYACNSPVRFRINLIELQEFDGEGAIASLKTGQNLTVRFQINLIELEEFDGEGAIAPVTSNSQNSKRSHENNDGLS